jgi:hypothetical protein
LYCRTLLAEESEVFSILKGIGETMTVTVYARHSSKCSKSKEKNAGQWKRCKCHIWLQWNENGNQFKKSAKTRSWEIATKAARKLEEELELTVNGVEPLKKPDHITTQSAVDLYLSDMRQRSLAKPTVDKARRMIIRLRDYASARGIILLKDVTPRSLIGGSASPTEMVDHGTGAVTLSGSSFRVQSKAPRLLIPIDAIFVCLPHGTPLVLDKLPSVLFEKFAPAVLRWLIAVVF